MEVFLHNLPSHLTDEGLRKQLEPFVRRLGIVDYLCEKPKRKPFGHVTFLHREDGERFILAHGQEELPQAIGTRGRPRLKSKMQLVGTDVFCARSKRPPQELALRSLEHTAEQRTKDSVHKYEEEVSVSFGLQGVSCGYCEFSGDQVAYVPEVQFQDTGIMKFKKRVIIVKLRTNRLIRIPLSTVVGLVWSRKGDMTLTLSTVPYFFSVETSVDILMTMVYNLSIKSHGVANGAAPTRLRKCSLDQRHAEVVGQCLVYQFRVSPIDLLTAIQELKHWEVTIIHYDLISGGIRSVTFEEHMSLFRRQLASYARENLLPFGVLFQLQALAYNGYLLPQTVMSLANELWKEYKANRKEGQTPISVPSIRKLFGMIPWPFPHEDPANLEVASLMAALRQNEKDIQLGIVQGQGVLGPTQNLALIHRVMVTPTRVTLHGPEPEPFNRILRRFPNHHDNFIRVQFCDEEGGDLYFNSRVNFDDVFSRFKNVLTRGIQIAGRTYSFLGWSHSSLRAHSFSSPFFDANGNFQTYFSIIKALGDFSKIISPARCAARIGQAFSETPFAVPIKANNINIVEVPDMRSEDGSRVFSDGVGSLSIGALHKIWANIPSKKGRPTCFQIRLGGSKGMIAVDSRLPGSVIQVRPSMIKFDADMIDLEICDMANKPIPLVLNRQMIKILEDMGVAEDWFFNLQTTQLQHLRSITASARNTAVFIKRQAIGDCFGLFRLFYQAHLLQINYKKVPFLRSLVEAVVLREVRLLKHRARIPVKKGITLFGIVDETEFLQSDEVYVTFETVEGRFEPPPPPGRLLITRSPALHDGDIQQAYQVLPPANHPLRQHRNCVVFSAKGDRDLPSKLSGGDLDGDIYNIIWDPEARPKCTFKPADYPRVEPLSVGRLVTADDMADFFIDFMRTDHLGVIATRHMILADQKDEGTSHPDCKRLAQLHSTAVDFSKTGIPVELGELPKANNFRPDFLAPGPQAHIYAKSDIYLDRYVLQTAYDEDDDHELPRKYYRSEKILGKLYRAVDERKIWFNEIHSETAPDEEFFWEEFIWSITRRCNAFSPISCERWIDEATCIRLAYEDAIFSARNNYSDHPIKPLSELEVFIGSVINKSGVQTRRQRDQSQKLADEFERIASWITDQMHRHRKVEIPRTDYKTGTETLELCLACFQVAEEQNADSTYGRRNDYGELKSFRIVAACALLAELDILEKGQKQSLDSGLTG
ncbi:hypothetical protein CNMCM6936_009648 [Aspergillus lentulus]|uniref:RNA-dependent RNA polymerase n=1 Tax=Aspergillus lentulus TaxID=293939 RepID=A0AAN5YVV7_ASPLE|nr:hypothetical protein CNMCM6936_009648 [Aspergillus lentulus]KAF4209579.1 hypothetical protein CNMCM8927_005979 [Aspergillus lentulus]